MTVNGHASLNPERCEPLDHKAASFAVNGLRKQGTKKEARMSEREPVGSRSSQCSKESWPFQGTY